MSEDVEFRSKDFADVMLTEDDISAIINGKKVYKVTPKGEKISISQSLLVGMLAPLVNYENQVMSQTEVNNKIDVAKYNTEMMMKDVMKKMGKDMANTMQSSMRLGS